MTGIFDTSGPRVFGLPPGVDFTGELARGLRTRLTGHPVEALARTQIAINTSRAARTLAAAFETGDAATFLPRIETFERFVEDPRAPIAPAIDRLERRLTLTRLIGAMLQNDPSLGPPGAAGPLADTLARLLDEMHAAKAPLSRLADAVTDEALADHWAASLKFLGVLGAAWPDHLAERGRIDPEARYAAAAAAKIAALGETPPDHVVIAAGSTGSKRVTADLLIAVASAPQGAVILPGFDFALDADGWAAATPEHPQFGYRELLDRFRLSPVDVRPWTGKATPGPRARLLAETLRPAPVTHHWLTTLPSLRQDIPDATRDLTLIEAPSPRREAEAIALILREALEGEGAAALVTSDRTLARRVAAVLARWGIEPDDSAGRPLSLTPPGIFLTATAALLTRHFDAVALLALLKHPYADVPPLEVARLEMEGLRNRDIAHRLTGVDALIGAHAFDDAPLVDEALARGLSCLSPWPAGQARPLADLVRAHRTAAEGLANNKLWADADGAAAAAALTRLEETAGAYGAATPADYPALLSTALSEAGDVASDAFRGHPRLSIWGTLEARAQTADTLVLGGLNEGVWPAQPAPDPWLNRQMRAAVGLNAPERRIGLAAHDFLQAASAPRVFLTRAVKSDGAPTTPARWLSRLTTLLEGADMSVLEAMKTRGADWLAWAQAMDAPSAPVAPAPRPEPRPPVAARPRGLSVTEIETLIRDPYSIYARRILRLRALDEPGAPPDKRLRGETLHLVMERFLAASDPWPGAAPARALFDQIADDVVAEMTPPPALSRIWRARLARVAPWIVEKEAARRAESHPIGAELKGEVVVPTAAGRFTLRGRADRIDRLNAGGVAIYDYKAGQAPSDKQAKTYAKQLPLLGAMAEAGAFEAFAAETAAVLTYIILSGAKDGGDDKPIEPDPAALDGLVKLISAFENPDQAFIPRASPEKQAWTSDYEHLSRYGEWTDRAPGDEA